MRMASAACALVFSIFVGLLGCGGAHDTKEEGSSLVSVRSGRLVFKTAEAFRETINQLDKMNQQELDAWEARLKIDSYQQRFAQQLQGIARESSSIDEEFYRFPSSLRAIINTDGELQVGDEILWYNNGNIYSVPANDEARLQQLKKDPSIVSPKGNYSITRIADGASSSPGSTSGQAVGIGIFNGLDSRYQHEFYWWGNLRKYVHELYSYSQRSPGFYDPNFGYGYTYASRLYLRIKLEWRGSRSWKPASESRLIQYGLNYTVRMCNMHVPPNTTQSQCDIGHSSSLNGNELRSSAWDVLVAEFSAPQFGGGDPYWYVEMSGSITQHIQGDPSTTPWVNSGYPLW